MQFDKFDKAMMETAYVWAKVSYCKRRQVGAVISMDNRIISHGYNGTISGHKNKCEDRVITCPKCNKDITLGVNDTFVDYDTIYDVECPHCFCLNKGSKEFFEENIRLKTNEFVLHAEQNAIINAHKQGKIIVGATIYITTSPCPTCAKLIAGNGIAKVFYREEYKDQSGVEFLKRCGIEVYHYKQGEDSEQ